MLITPQILSYWTGGYTQSRFDGITLTATGIGAGPAGPMSVAANTYHGWFTGGGVETQVTSIPGLFFNTEYRYASYSSATMPITGATAALGAPTSLKLQPSRTDGDVGRALQIQLAALNTSPRSVIPRRGTAR